MKTVQRILTSHSSTNQHSSPLFQEKCSSFLEACGNREATPEDFCREVNHALWELLNLMIEAEEVSSHTPPCVALLIPFVVCGTGDSGLDDATFISPLHTSTPVCCRIRRCSDGHAEEYVFDADSSVLDASRTCPGWSKVRNSYQRGSGH